MFRALTIVVLMVVCPTIVRADGPSVSGGQSPAVYIAVPWRNPDGSVHDGYWFTVEQVGVIDRRIRYLEDKAAKECVDVQVGAAKRTSVWWQIGLGILTGATIGFCAAHDKHCGL